MTHRPQVDIARVRKFVKWPRPLRYVHKLAIFPIAYLFNNPMCLWLTAFRLLPISIPHALKIEDQLAQCQNQKELNEKIDEAWRTTALIEKQAMEGFNK